MIIYYYFSRSRRPDAIPCTSLVLQLMDFEEQLAKKCNKKSKKSNSAVEVIFERLPLTANWKAKIKVAYPMLILLLILSLLCKVVYEILFESSIFKEDNMDEELVCY